MNNSILVINSGSSSIKFSLIDIAEHNVSVSGVAEKLGEKGACLHVMHNNQKRTNNLDQGAHGVAMEAILHYLRDNDLAKNIKAVGHRVVHGGEYFKTATIITADVLEAIKKCVSFAPLHNPANLLGITTAMIAFPELPQVAVFDTAFHQTLAPYAFRYAVPQDWYIKFGARRYGFHGTSHQFVSTEAARILNIDLADSAFITAHLGNGASASAILNGRSVDTTMGFTPLEGLVMGSRSGDIDPGLVQFIAEALAIDLEEVIGLLNKKSGLLGLSGLSGDVRELQEAAANGHEGAILALEVFVFRLAKYIGALMISLPRVDALIFTGGIGENSSFIRKKTLERLAVLGYKIDTEANDAATGGRPGVISATGSITTMVVNTNEELMIALESMNQIGH